MSEPTTSADTLHEIAPGILHWTIRDERIDFRSEAYAVATDLGTIVLDPLPLTEAAYDELGPVAAIYLTGRFHQRAASSFRDRFGARVHAPAGASGFDEQPDERFTDGHRAAEGLIALDRPGPSSPHYVFRLDATGGCSALFCGDLLMRGDDGPFALVPDEHHDDPVRTRDSVRRLLEPPVDLLCPAHGAPALTDATQRIREALR